MNKLQDIKEKAKELFELINSYEQELFQEGIKMGRQQVYDAACNQLSNVVYEFRESNKETEVYINDIPNAKRILNATSVIRELFPDLNT